MPVKIAVIGFKYSGKTTIVKELCKLLTEKGYRPIPIKHIAHSEFSIDSQNTDTYTLRKASGVVSFYADSKEAGLILNIESPESYIEFIEKIAKTLDYNVLIFEGFRKIFSKDTDVLKIICLREIGELTYFEDIEGPYIVCTFSEINDRRILKLPKDFDTLKSLVVRYVEISLIFEKLPKLNCGKCIAGSCRRLAELIYRGVAKFEDCRVVGSGDVKLRVNDTDIPLNEFVRTLIKNVILGIVRSLKGVPEDVRSVSLSIRFA